MIETYEGGISLKKFACLAISGAIFLAGCGNNDTDALKKEIEQLKKQRDKSKQELKELKEENQTIDKDIKEKQSDIDALKKEKEAEIKAQIKQEEKIKAQQAAKEKERAKAAAEAAKKEADEKKASEQKVIKARKQSTMPNTIAASTGGKVKVVKSMNDIEHSLKDAGMSVAINRLQIFKVSEMPKDQVLLFNGATEGYVLIYEVTANNTTDQPLYYNNVGMLNIGDKQLHSEYASFIPSELQEIAMKKSKSSYNEYAPHEQTISYKSIVINSEDYKKLTQSKAKLMIKGGVSETKDMKNKTETNSKGIVIQ